jgi:hypothetical protein
MKGFWIFVLLPLFSLQTSDNTIEISRKTCECIHESGKFQNCDQKYVSANKVLIEELMLYCDVYHAGFMDYRNKTYSSLTPEKASNLLEENPIDLLRTNNSSTLIKYVKWSFMANKHDLTMNIIEHMEKLKNASAETYLYKGWVLEIWDDLYAAEEAYQKFLQFGDNRKLAYQCLANILWLERETQEDED